MDLAFHSVPCFKVEAAASNSIFTNHMPARSVGLSVPDQAGRRKLRATMTPVRTDNNDGRQVWVDLYHVCEMWQPSEGTQRHSTHPPTLLHPTTTPPSPLHQPTFSWSMQNPSHSLIDHSIAVSPQALGQTLFSHSRLNKTELQIWTFSFHVSPYQSHRSKGR